ncbi:Rsd/AlgQ family anti-sigma factor [Thalassotalea crassostreae]|uniref:Rsd/AlgQ family anti-sigma factor n=1 Tax=Thalassotalea crassostreae TaxID=1763536 RepID=UPI000838A278|nr:Rsd/AlgQ family anti-sigma factor [Thalassotalea crassostreae]
MLTRLEQAQQQWGGSLSAIDNWLNERQEVLVSYYQLAGLAPSDQTDRALPNAADIQAFCQLLMDYLSAGHFEVFDQIVAQCKKNGPDSLALAQKIYPEISKTTDIALAFNDKFAEPEDDSFLESFDASLSVLGQALEERFELEDQLIEALYKKHS